MVRMVSEVPNPWKKYSDGHIYEFTKEELEGMPRWSPMTDYTQDGVVIGKRMIQWYRNDKYYIRFLEGPNKMTFEEWELDEDYPKEEQAQA